MNASLCRHPAEWPWSSYRETAAGDVGFLALERLLPLFGGDEATARHRYRDFVEEGLPQS